MVRLALFLSVFAASATAGPMDGEVFCDVRENLVDTLVSSWGAERLGTGLRGPDAVVELWTIKGTGEWTLVQSYANGRACVVAMGESWEPVATVLPEEMPG